MKQHYTIKAYTLIGAFFSSKYGVILSDSELHVPYNSDEGQDNIAAMNCHPQEMKEVIARIGLVSLVLIPGSAFAY